MSHSLTIADGSKKIRLSDIDTGAPKHSNEESMVKEEAKLLLKMADLQSKLYAEGKKGLLIVLQGMDASGKDGTVRKVFAGINPQGVHVVSFKVPTPEELRHDYLWRVHHHVPEHGMIGIFNRSHYEDVLVVRVENLAPEKVWRRRYDEINGFEKYLFHNDIITLKFFLHISKAEQRKRFLKRLENPHKHWKFQREDIEKRKDWHDYQKAYEDVINECGTPHAPWYIVPSDDKPYRNLLIAKAIVDQLEKINPKYPEPMEDLTIVKIPD